VCGRTTRKPLCDKSCSLTEKEYLERCIKLEKLFGIKPKEKENDNTK